MIRSGISGNCIGAFGSNSIIDGTTYESIGGERCRRMDKELQALHAELTDYHTALDAAAEGGGGFCFMR